MTDTPTERVQALGFKSFEEWGEWCKSRYNQAAANRAAYLAAHPELPQGKVIIRGEGSTHDGQFR